jgi:IS30 family transposase
MMCGEYKHVSLDEKKKIAYGLVMSGMSQRKVSELLSMARPTIKKTLEEMRDI